MKKILLVAYAIVVAILTPFMVDMAYKERGYKLKCAYCGKDFISYGNKKRKYCSHYCYIHDRFWKKEEGRI